MSEEVHYKGRLKYLKSQCSLEEQCEKIFKNNGEELASYWDSYEEALYYKDDYTIVDGKVFQVLEKEEVDEEIASIVQDKDDLDILHYEVAYYNGGCSFDEALNDSFKGKYILFSDEVKTVKKEYKKFEYIQVELYSKAKIIGHLNELGKQGWELAFSAYDPRNGLKNCIFKREIIAEKTECPDLGSKEYYKEVARELEETIGRFVEKNNNLEKEIEDLKKKLKDN